MAGEGRIFQQKGRGPFWLAFQGPRPDGSWGEIRESAETTDRRVAERKLNDRVREAKNHRAGDKTFEPTAAAKLTVADLCDALEGDLRSRGIKSLEQSLLHLKWPRQILGRTKALAVRADTVRRYVAQRKALGRANATVNRETELLAAAFKLAVTEEKLARVPPFPKALDEKNNTRTGFFEAADVDRLITHLPAPLGDLVMLAFLSGWRRDELRLLKWGNVDMAAKTIRLETSKNDEPRSLPLGETPEDWAIIERCLAARSYIRTTGASALSQWVFHRNGLPVNRSVLRRQWNRACVAADLGRWVTDAKGEVIGYTGRIFHDLRRSAVRNMVRAGVSRSVARAISGHKTESMFERYNITDERDKMGALAAVRVYRAGAGRDQAGARSNVVGITSRSS